MLQVPELKRAMGLDDKYRIEQGTRRDRIRLLGNGVCPPVMEAVVRSLTRGEMTVDPTPAKRPNHRPFRSEPPGALPALPEPAHQEPWHPIDPRLRSRTPVGGIDPGNSVPLPCYFPEMGDSV
jgi:hypothetical protein